MILYINLSIYSSANWSKITKYEKKTNEINCAFSSFILFFYSYFFVVVDRVFTFLIFLHHNVVWFSFEMCLFFVYVYQQILIYLFVHYYSVGILTFLVFFLLFLFYPIWFVFILDSWNFLFYFISICVVNKKTTYDEFGISFRFVLIPFYHQIGYKFHRINFSYIN